MAAEGARVWAVMGHRRRRHTAGNGAPPWGGGGGVDAGDGVARRVKQRWAVRVVCVAGCICMCEHGARCVARVRWCVAGDTW